MILTSSKLLLLSGLQTIVALVFLRGFLLTRVELPDVAECQSHSCNSQLPQYQKAVVLIVDAVRYDFLCGKQDEHGQLSRSLMPRTLQLVQAGVRTVHRSMVATGGCASAAAASVMQTL